MHQRKEHEIRERRQEATAVRVPSTCAELRRGGVFSLIGRGVGNEEMTVTGAAGPSNERCAHRLDANRQPARRTCSSHSRGVAAVHAEAGCRGRLLCMHQGGLEAASLQCQRFIQLYRNVGKTL